MRRKHNALPQTIIVLLSVIGMATHSASALAEDDDTSNVTATLVSAELTRDPQAFTTDMSIDMATLSPILEVSLIEHSENSIWLLVTLELANSQPLGLVNKSSIEFVSSSGDRIPGRMPNLTSGELQDAFDQYGVVWGDDGILRVTYDPGTRELKVLFDVPEESPFPGELSIDGQVVFSVEDSDL